MYLFHIQKTWMLEKWVSKKKCIVFLLVNKIYKCHSLLGTNKMDPSLLFLSVNHSTFLSLLLTQTTKGLLKSLVESLPQSYKHQIKKSIVWKNSNIHYFGKHFARSQLSNTNWNVSKASSSWLRACLHYLTALYSWWKW